MVKIKTSPLEKKRKNEINNAVDKSVGSRLKLRRNIIGMSQENLAKEIGVSFQQVQKYERGANRISASRLYRISRVLDVPVTFFFHDISVSAGCRVGKMPSNRCNRMPQITSTLLNSSESLELVKNFWELPKNSRKTLIGLLKELTKNED